jgi:hypothetical protein
MRKTLTTLLTLLLFSICTSAQQRRQVRVSVKVTADEVIQSQLISNINSGLRNLGDVVIAGEDDVKMHIDIVVLKTSNVGGRVSGYAVSIVVTESQISKQTVKKIVDGATPAGFQRNLLNDICTGVTIIHHSVLSGLDDLTDIAKRIVAEIDADPIENERKFLQKVEDSTKKP